MRAIGYQNLGMPCRRGTSGRSKALWFGFAGFASFALISSACDERQPASVRGIGGTSDASVPTDAGGTPSLGARPDAASQGLSTDLDGDARPSASPAGDDPSDAEDERDGYASSDSGVDDFGADAFPDSPIDSPDKDVAIPAVDADGGAPGATAALIAAQRGAACLACAVNNHCLDPGEKCEDLAGIPAVAGPEAGGDRSGLCLDTLTCIFTTGCFEAGTGVDVCLCGFETVSDCLNGGPVTSGGECVGLEQAGLETTDPVAERAAQADLGLGGGVANAVAMCVIQSSCADCL